MRFNHYYDIGWPTQGLHDLNGCIGFSINSKVTEILLPSGLLEGILILIYCPEDSLALSDYNTVNTHQKIEKLDFQNRLQNTLQDDKRKIGISW